MKTINYGIDLGTSNSCIAFGSDGKVEIFKSNEGTDFISSAVMHRGRLLVGADAYKNQARRPEHVAVKFKRAMGTNQMFHLEGLKPQRPEDLSAQVLIELKRLASLRDHHVEHAVICTPATFNSSMVDATNEAARLAGIHDPVLISEPMAASYGYGVTTDRQGTWLVYDLGAGTFDAVVVQVRDGKMTLLDIEGANKLGGSDMDRLLWENAVIPAIAKLAGISREHRCFTDFAVGGKLLTERTKIRLSNDATAEINVDEIEGKDGNSLEVDGRRVECEVSLSRSALDSIVEPLIDKSFDICQRLLEKHKQVSEVLLIGGPTNMPIVRAKLERLGLPLNTRVDPMTAVATGAALYASTVPAKAGKATTVSFAMPQASRGVVKLQLDHEPACEDTEAPVIVRCSDPRAGFAEFTSASRNWTSGRIPLSEDGHTLLVPIQPRKTNTFVIHTFTSTGTALECEPAEFFIFSTLVAEAPPVPESLWIEVDDESSGGVARGIEIIKKGTPLPAKGMVTVHTKRELARGSSNDVKIKLFEGNSPVLRANRLFCLLPLNGEVVPRKLPVNTQIEVTVKVDASRRITAVAYISAADESFEIPKFGERADVTNPHHLEFRCRALRDQVEMLEEENDSMDVKVKLELCRRQLWSADLTKALRSAKSGDRDGGDAHQRVDETLREVEERLVLLREKEQEHLLPAEWRRACQASKGLIQSGKGAEQDQQHFEEIRDRGDGALQRKRWVTLKETIREMGRLGFEMNQRQPEFWHAMAAGLPSEPELYVNPNEARETLARLTRPRSLDELRADVVRLVRLLPTDGRGAREDLAWVVAAG